MPQFYSLEEAARVLGLNPEELKEKAQSRQIRAFMDSGSWRFRVADIDEEARRRGIGSDPELSLSDLDLVAQGESASSDNLTEFQLGVASPDSGESTDQSSLSGRDSDADILLDDITAPEDRAGGSSSTIIGMATPEGKLPSDSDVRLLPDQPGLKGASDSDVRLGVHGPSDSDVTLVSDDMDSSMDLGPGVSGDFGDTEYDPNQTLQHQSPLIGSSGEVPAVSEDSESDFELTPSSVIDALEPESGSDFELTPLDASSDEFDTDRLRGPSDSDVTGAEPSTSGINLGRPSDSGINLQSVSNFDMDSAESIELAPLDDGDQPAPKAPPQAAREPEKVDLSATALPMRADKDIFEDTDFEVDALDGGNEDRTVQLEAASDFDLEEDSDSASQVFAIDEEDVDENAATAMGPAVLDDDEEDELDVSDAAMAEEAESGAWDVESTTPTTSRSTPVIASAGAGQVEWGGLWVGLLSVATVLMMLLAFVGMDVVRNLYEFRGGGPASGLIELLAGLMG